MECSKPPSPRKDAGLQSGGGHKPSAHTAGRCKRYYSRKKQDPMALLQYRFCITSLTTSLALQSVVRLGACSGKQWQAVASVKEGDKAMEIGMNEVLIQSGSQIDVYSFGQGSSRNENFCTWPLDWGSFSIFPASDFSNSPNSLPPCCLCV